MATRQEKEEQRKAVALRFRMEFESNNKLTPARFAKQHNIPETSVLRAIKEHYPEYEHIKKQQQHEFAKNCNNVISSLVKNGPQKTCEKMGINSVTISSYIAYYNRNHKQKVTQGLANRNLVISMYLEKSMKISDIAKSLNLQKSTVSYYLNHPSNPPSIKSQIAHRRSINASSKQSIKESRNLFIEATQVAGLFFDMVAAEHKGFDFRKSKNKQSHEYLVITPSGDYVLLKLKTTRQKTGEISIPKLKNNIDLYSAEFILGIIINDKEDHPELHLLPAKDFSDKKYYRLRKDGRPGEYLINISNFEKSINKALLS